MAKRRKTRPIVEKPEKLSRTHLVQREHKDLSTSEIQFRIQLLTGNIGGLELQTTELSDKLGECRRSLRVAREDVQALEQIVESRR